MLAGHEEERHACLVGQLLDRLRRGQRRVEFAAQELDAPQAPQRGVAAIVATQLDGQVVRAATGLLGFVGGPVSDGEERRREHTLQIQLAHVPVTGCG